MISRPLVLVFWAGLALAAAAKEQVLRTEANVPIEITFHAARNYPDPFNQLTLDVTFIDPRGRELRVPAFWDGGNT